MRACESESSVSVSMSMSVNVDNCMSSYLSPFDTVRYQLGQIRDGHTRYVVFIASTFIPRSKSLFLQTFSSDRRAKGRANFARKEKELCDRKEEVKSSNSRALQKQISTKNHRQKQQGQKYSDGQTYLWTSRVLILFCMTSRNSGFSSVEDRGW